MKGEISEAKKKIEENMVMSGSDDEEVPNVPIFTSELAKLKDGEDDDMKDINDNYPSELSDSEEEKDDYTIRKSDSLVIAATAEEDFNNLEVYVYDHKTSDLYVHHEVILGAMPLCLEWLN